MKNQQSLIDAYIDTVKAVHEHNPSPALVSFTKENGKLVSNKNIQNLFNFLYDQILVYNNEIGRRN